MFDFKSWWHHFIDPHCIDCAFEKSEARQCKSCDTLRLALDQANREKHDLLNHIMQLTIKSEVVEDKPYVPVIADVKPKFVPWRVKQQELEAADRMTAKLMQDKKKEMDEATLKYEVKVPATATIEELENEVLEGVENAGDIN